MLCRRNELRSYARVWKHVGLRETVNENAELFTVGNGGGRSGFALLRLFRGGFHAVAKRANAFSETLAEFRKLLRTEEDDSYSQNQQ
jgi:hypothetical protein